MQTWRSYLYLIFLLITTHGTLESVLLPAFAQAPVQESHPTPPEESKSPPRPEGFFLKTASEGKPRPAPLLHTTVNITISGLIARTTVSQKFFNTSDEWAEGIYVFPLPDQAAVDHMRMKIGERIIEGQIQERTQAKKTYQKAKASGKQASLVEQERPNVFTTSVANIAPNSQITVEIEYQEMVRYDQGRFSLRFPMVVGPRYIPGRPEVFPPPLNQESGTGWAPNTDQVLDASRITPPVQHPAQGPINLITLDVNLASGMLLQGVESPTHLIRVSKDETGNHRITFKNSDVHADRDFELIWTPLSVPNPQIALFSEELEQDTYIFLQVMPPISRVPSTPTMPREVIFVIDTSGSMAGASLTQAKAALTLALSRLTAHDSFNIIQFNSRTHSLYSRSRPASADRIHKAQRYVEGLHAQGGTEMRPALIRALTQTSEADTPRALRQIIFITDGLVGNEHDLFKIVQQDLRESRLFTVGIGSAPNSHFMRKAAEFGKGTFTFIRSTQEVQEKMGRLFQKLEQPALIDLALKSSTPILRDMVPNPIPDLYVGEPLTIVFRGTELPPAITIHGRQGERIWETTQSLEDSQPRQGIAVHWARQRIAQLMDHQTQQTEKDSLRKHIIEIALKHHIVSRYTSLVAVDVTPVRPQQEALHAHALKTNLPQGMSYEAIFGWPRTATPSRLYLLGGFLLLCLAWIWSRHHALRT